MSGKVGIPNWSGGNKLFTKRSGEILAFMKLLSLSVFRIKKTTTNYLWIIVDQNVTRDKSFEHDLKLP